MNDTRHGAPLRCLAVWLGCLRGARRAGLPPPPRPDGRPAGPHHRRPRRPAVRAAAGVVVRAVVAAGCVPGCGLVTTLVTLAGGARAGPPAGPRSPRSPAPPGPAGRVRRRAHRRSRRAGPRHPRRAAPGPHRSRGAAALVQGLPLPDRATGAPPRRRPDEPSGATGPGRPRSWWCAPATPCGTSRGQGPAWHRALRAQPRRDRPRPRPDPARPAAAPAPLLTCIGPRGAPMSPSHEKVVPLRPPVPVASVQGTLALDLQPRHDPPEHSRHGLGHGRPATSSRSTRACAASSSSGRAATPRPRSRSSAATARSPSCCAGRAARCTPTSQRRAQLVARAGHHRPGRAGCSRSAPRCWACTPAS